MRQLALPLPFLAEERAGPLAPPSLGPNLPPWESFPAEDRRTLVLLLVETGRRRVPPRPASRPTAPSGRQERRLPEPGRLGGCPMGQEPPEHAREGYVHGYSTSEQERLGSRRATGAAGFFIPHLHSGMSLLDCGCGPGSITLDLAEVVAPGRVVGLDVEARQIEAARTLAADRSVANVSFEVGSIYELPFPDASFDAVFANTVLLHLREPRRALIEMRRVLRAGGVAGVADGDFATWLWEPSSPRLRQLQDLFRRALRHRGGDPHLARHYRQLLVESGFARSEGYGVVSSDTHGTPSGTRQFASVVAQQLRAPSFGGFVVEQGWTTAGELEEMLAEVRAWGERPDAFHAVLNCAAVGWAGDAR